MEYGDTSRTQVVGSNALGVECSNMRPKSSAVEPERDFGQLPLAASVVEFSNHQKYSRLHLQLTTTQLRVAARSPAMQSRLLRRRRSEEHTSELQSRPHLVCR